jgi:hypothetical protein
MWDVLLNSIDNGAILGEIPHDEFVTSNETKILFAANGIAELGLRTAIRTAFACFCGLTTMEETRTVESLEQSKKPNQGS